MAKKPQKIIKLQILAAEAKPGPPVGTALGPTGVNMMDFCKQFNDRTKEQAGMTIPVVISIYEDRTFSFVTKTPPAAVLIKKALKIEKGSAEPHKNKVATLSKKQVAEIAALKLPDLSANDAAAAEKIIAGTARSMGVLIEKASSTATKK